MQLCVGIEEGEPKGEPGQTDNSERKMVDEYSRPRRMKELRAATVIFGVGHPIFGAPGLQLG